MISNKVKNKRLPRRIKGDMPDSHSFKILVRELRETLFPKEGLVADLSLQFSGLNQDTQQATPEERNARGGMPERVIHQNKRLMHKLLRIHREFTFVKEHVANYQELTQRELEILRLLIEGKNNPKIAEQLFISRATVEQHRKHINYKLKIKSFTHLMHYGYAFDLV